MFWEKKTRPVAQPGSISPEEASPADTEVETLMSVPIVKVPSMPPWQEVSIPSWAARWCYKAQLSAHEDLAIEGQFEGTSALQAIV